MSASPSTRPRSQTLRHHSIASSLRSERPSPVVARRSLVFIFRAIRLTNVRQPRSRTLQRPDRSRRPPRKAPGRDPAFRNVPTDAAALREMIIAFFEAAMVEDQLVLPYAKQGLLSDVYEHTCVLSEDYDATGRIMRVRGLPDAITRLRRTLAVP